MPVPVPVPVVVHELEPQLDPSRAEAEQSAALFFDGAGLSVRHHGYDCWHGATWSPSKRPRRGVSW